MDRTATLSGKAVIGQSGGPTNVINQSLVGAVEEARRHGSITGFYGALHGVKGVLSEELIDLFAESSETLKRIAETPSAALGSVRKKPSPEECHEIFKVLQAHEVRFFFYIGGNDSAETTDIIFRLALEARYSIGVFHIPKTIDNDLLVTDHCPGYGSAARFVALAFMGDNLDNRALPGVKINVVMGRNAGFLTAASVLGRRREDDGPHLVYVPEAPFDKGKFLSAVEVVFKRHGRCMVAVSEGIADVAGNPIYQSGEEDSHGNVQLSGSGALGDFLADLLKRELKISRVRADTFGYMQRCFPTIVSEVDSREAREVGALAVRSAAREGLSSGSVAIRRAGEGKDYRSEYFVTPLETVAKHTRKLDARFIAPAGNNITEAFVQYALPLIGPLPNLGRFEGKRIPKKLKP
ncbi:MAG: 6-phosphofructokinase [Planctomycetes bacterium]|nr:6-phosphofructokinase [Planctomycetota bacterium]